MAKFDVYRLGDGGLHLLDCQADLLDVLNTRLVVPLMPVEDAPVPAARLNPVFVIAGGEYVMVTQFAASISVSELTQRVVSLAEHDIAIGNALDMLISGF
ncbi:MAG: plasmid maintenance protein CcdB [Sphingobium sp.]|jgi:toxin CcdB|nr:MAG: plasmid maintenance protein CcdB [Sphingobium sp.]